jgi:hypothetical protein
MSLVGAALAEVGFDVGDVRVAKREAAGVVPGCAGTVTVNHQAGRWGAAVAVEKGKVLILEVFFFFLGWKIVWFVNTAGFGRVGGLVEWDAFFGRLIGVFAIHEEGVVLSHCRRTQATALRCKISQRRWRCPENERDAVLRGSKRVFGGGGNNYFVKSEVKGNIWTAAPAFAELLVQDCRR